MMQKINWNDLKSIETIRGIIEKEQLVAGSSDTVVGLLAASTKQGRNALDRIKKRTDMPYLVLVADLEAAKQFSSVFDEGPVAQIAQAFWPGPLTLIVPAKKEVPDYMKSTAGGIAMRVPAHDGLQKLLAQCGPLFSTSANISGKQVPETVDAIDPEIAQYVSLIVSDTEKRSRVPSTILDCTGEKITVIREGAISKQRLHKYI